MIPNYPSVKIEKNSVVISEDDYIRMRAQLDKASRDCSDYNDILRRLQWFLEKISPMPAPFNWIEWINGAERELNNLCICGHKKHRHFEKYYGCAECHCQNTFYGVEDR